MSLARRVISHFRPSGETPEQAFGAKASELFADLDPRLIDAYFANFGWVLPLSLVQQLIALCRALQPRLVVEFGCGVSTMALTGVLSEGEGMLLSFEEDAEWIARTQSMLDHPERVVFATAPRAFQARGLAHASLSRVMGGISPDIILVDGPARGDRFDADARELYRGLLSERVVVAFDDADRPATDHAAHELASAYALIKHDFVDPLEERRRFALLLPAGFPVPDTSAISLAPAS